MAVPTGPYENRSRDGFSTINNLSKTTCRLMGVFGPILRSKWSGSSNVIALLDAIDGVCALLIAAQTDVADYYTDGDNSGIDNDGIILPGGRLPDATPIP